MKLTHDQKALQFETWEHIHEVRKLLHRVQVEFGERALAHDQSKIYSEEECGTFAKYTPRLRDSKYGSEEYFNSLKEMERAINHHYAHNPHHPEYHEGGINGMNLFDLLEMICDWKAATLRHKDGDIYKSLELNKQRFRISDQLESILWNTIQYFEPRAIHPPDHFQ